MTPPNGGYLLLDAVTGWHLDPESGLVESPPDRALTLAPLPGRATPLFAKNDTPGVPLCPAAVAPAGCRLLLVLDAGRHRVDRVDVARGTSAPVREVGGLGSAARRFREPRGLARLCCGGLAVADTGNHRVQVFSRPPYALRQVWGATDDRGRPVPGNGPAEFRWPWAVAADPCGTLYILDRGNRRVQVFGGDGNWRGAFGSDVLTDPTRLALGPGGLVAVVDGPPADSAGPTSRLVLFTGGDQDQPRASLLPLTHPRSVAFDDAGRLYAGDAVGVIHVFDPSATDASRYRFVGEGATGLDGAIVELAWDRDTGLVAVVRERDESGVRVGLWRIDPAAGCVRAGTLNTGRLDSGLDHCHWHRLEVEAALPAGTKLGVAAFISGEESPDPASLDVRTWNSWTLTGDNPDLLFPSGEAGTGRFLWLSLTLQSDGDHVPTLTRFKIHFPRESYLQYLPSVYQEDDESRLFLERFLSIFQTTFDGFDRSIDTVWMRLIDPVSADARFLPWLAAALGLPTLPTWTESELRARIKGAYATYRVRGTVAGLEQAVSDYGGVPWGKVLEHYRLRRWPALSVDAPLDGSARLWSPDVYRRLRVGTYSRVGEFRLVDAPEPAVEMHHWGANRFSVFFPADPDRLEEVRRQVAVVVEREKPAHTEATLCPVFPRFRVGVQATVGVNSVVGGLSPLRLNRLATLGYDTVLSCSGAERQIKHLGTSPRPRVGVSLKLP